MIGPQELQLNRKHFTGLRYTEGVHYLAQAAECYWLIDAIASHQIAFTDFPLLEIKLYLEMGVILLPSER